MSEKLCSEQCTKCYYEGGYFFCEEAERAGNSGVIQEDKEVPQICEKKKLFVQRDTKTGSLF